jgi:hypothetical protein
MKDLTVKRKGVITEEFLKLWFLRKGFSVSVPIGDDDRYDFIVDCGGMLLRLQSKTANLTRKPGYLNFKTCSEHRNSQKNYRTKYSKNDIDFFCTIHPETEQVYIVPVEECGNECYLKLSPSDFKASGLRLASDYEGEKMIERFFSLN